MKIIFTDTCDCHLGLLTGNVEYFTSEKEAMTRFLFLDNQEDIMYWAVHLKGKHILNVIS